MLKEYCIDLASSPLLFQIPKHRLSQIMIESITV